MDSKPQLCVFLTILSLRVVSGCLDGECRELAFPSNFFFANKRLENHNITIVRVRDMNACELRCYHEPNYVSINFNYTASAEGTHRCDLNNATHRGHDSDLVHTDGYFYCGADGACDRAHCDSGGTCQSGFTDKGYRCLCRPGFMFAHCKQDFNECGEETHNCSTRAACINTEGSFACRVPDPVAWFPLNASYGIKEVNNRVTQGNHKNVRLAQGPDGKANGSYEFKGTWNSFIEFPNSRGGALDARYSITILCWLYYDGHNGPIFDYRPERYLGVKLGLSRGRPYIRLTDGYYSGSDYSTHTSIAGGWNFVGASYNHTSGEVKLWVDGYKVNERKKRAGLILSTYHKVRIGANKWLSFKGRIAQMQVYNLALNQEQIQAIQEQIQAIQEKIQRPVDFCRKKQFPCRNGGTCEIKGDGYICRCKIGFDGKNCEHIHELFMNSTMISGKEVYLHQFLQPVAANDSLWLLCYRASFHDSGVGTFHRRCDGKNHTVTVIKRADYVFGGYTDIPWDTHYGYGYTSNAFIFSLHNNEGRYPFKSMVKDPAYAIYRGSDFGPTFGRGSDIYIKTNVKKGGISAYTKFGGSYFVPSGMQNPHKALAGTVNLFAPDDWEVFYLASSSSTP